MIDFYLLYDFVNERVLAMSTDPMPNNLEDIVKGKIIVKVTYDNYLTLKSFVANYNYEVLR